MCRKAGLCIVQDPSYQMNVTRNACSRKRERIETTSAPQASPTRRAYCVCGSEAFAKSARPSAVDSTCLYTNVRTPPLLFGPATYDCFQLLLVEFDLERFSHKFGSCQRWGSLLQYRTSSGIDNSIKVSVHKLHAFLAAACTHQYKQSPSFRPPLHLLLCQRSILFYLRSAPPDFLHRDLLKCAAQIIVYTYDVRKSSIGTALT